MQPASRNTCEFRSPAPHGFGHFFPELTKMAQNSSAQFCKPVVDRLASPRAHTRLERTGAVSVRLQVFEPDKRNGPAR